jgi:hypothetical protein
MAVHMAVDKERDYKPGEKVPASGIYRVTHDPNHAEAHDVTAVIGETFPPCNGCGHHPRFRVKHLAHHISTHEHFK